MRKTLILYFECARSGKLYPIITKDWNKWLKISFSLIKCGFMSTISLGSNNPLGVISNGIDCICEVYNAYKTVDDEEFNTYITNPFLTSSEQVSVDLIVIFIHLFDFLRIC